MKSSDSRTNSKYKSPYGCRTNSHCEVFIQRFDELWMEKVDVESLNEVNDRDKLFLVCTEHINSNVEKEVCYSFKTYLPVFFFGTLKFYFSSGRRK